MPHDLVYNEPLQNNRPVAAKPSLAQAVKAMIFGFVALTLAEIPVFGFFILIPFAIISLCMASDYKKRFPGHGNGFLKAAKITAIISFPMCFVTTLFYVLAIAANTALDYYFY